MLLLFTNMFIVTLILMVLVMIYLLFSWKSINDMNKSSAFECGFDFYKTARAPFSLRFFLITMVFLIFDVEITLVLPLPSMLNELSFNLLFYFTCGFVGILVMGLFHEWHEGALEWA